MKKVLIIDDDITIVKFLKTLISSQYKYPVASAKSFKEARLLIEENIENFAAVLVDPVLPDAKNGECVDFVLEKDIPCIVMTDDLSKETQKHYMQKEVLDCVMKGSVNSFDYSLRLLQFIYGFSDSHILLVDDSETSRLQMRLALGKLPLNIHEAGNGKEALEVLTGNPLIQLVITDRNMPEMDGLELIQEIRKNFRMNELAIIGISASSEPMMCVEFLKNGANDFINKPLVAEEMFSRVLSNLEMLYYVQLAEESATRDYLTGLYNRKYLFETGQKLHENAKRDSLSLVVAMMDIDHFKKINDRYGHEAGDVALKRLGELLEVELRRSDVLARYGGEEFCVILTNTTLELAKDVMERVRKKLEETVINLNKISFRMTLSIGLNSELAGSLEDMIALADKKLYQAKEQGRNRVVY